MNFIGNIENICPYCGHDKIKANPMEKYKDGTEKGTCKKCGKSFISHYVLTFCGQTTMDYTLGKVITI